MLSTSYSYTFFICFSFLLLLPPLYSFSVLIYLFPFSDIFQLQLTQPSLPYESYVLSSLAFDPLSVYILLLSLFTLSLIPLRVLYFLTTSLLTLFFFSQSLYAITISYTHLPLFYPSCSSFPHLQSSYHFPLSTLLHHLDSLFHSMFVQCSPSSPHL